MKVVGASAEQRHSPFYWELRWDILTFTNTEDVALLSEQLTQALHQQQSFVVAQGRCFPLVEHLIQRSIPNLRRNQDVNAG